MASILILHVRGYFKTILSYIMAILTEALSVIIKDGQSVNGTLAETAVEVILSAGMDVKRQGPINIPILSDRGGVEIGSVKLRRKAIGGAAYVWQVSDDVCGVVNQSQKKNKSEEREQCPLFFIEKNWYIFGVKKFPAHEKNLPPPSSCVFNF